ncbi:MAG: acyl-CoA reductase [Ferruginibacter sp.]
MILQERIEVMARLGEYLKENTPNWQATKEKAFQHNAWFITDFIDKAVENIVSNFLQIEKLQQWANHYHLDDTISQKNIGIVMAGNIPLVGFHDLLCVFVSGHRQTIKLSSKDNILIPFLLQILIDFDEKVAGYILIAEMLKGCDAYIATGSNNSARYFEQYFAKYPHIIRKNKTSLAVLSGEEREEQLASLADDIHLYFGLGCRNVTKIYVPHNYDFVPLLQSFKKYLFFLDHHKYSNNYDYQLALMLMNKIYYMTNEATLLIEAEAPFSAISVMHYEFYEPGTVHNLSLVNDDVQAVIGRGFIDFGQAQQPLLEDYADSVDTMAFLLTL